MDTNTAQNYTQQRSTTAKPFVLSANDPIRIGDPYIIGYDKLSAIITEVENAPLDLLLQVRQRTYDVLDRMDEILLDGGHIPTEQCDEIIMGIAVLEEIIAKKTNGKGA